VRRERKTINLINMKELTKKICENIKLKAQTKHGRKLPLKG
jgi:hypothetical protein